MPIDPNIPISKAVEQPTDETGPEVEGHLPRIIIGAEAEVEGHMPRVGRLRAPQAETGDDQPKLQENGRRLPYTEQPATDPEVEGHAPRGPVSTLPSDDERTGADDLEPEVTGHAPRGPVVATGADDLEPETT